jgi:hypothetical protein
MRGKPPLTPPEGGNGRTLFDFRFVFFVFFEGFDRLYLKYPLTLLTLRWGFLLLYAFQYLGEDGLGGLIVVDS